MAEDQENASAIRFFNYHEYVINRGNRQQLLTDFPNPHVAENSPEFVSTRIVRIPRAYHGSTTGDIQNSCPQFSEYFPGKEPGGLVAGGLDEDGNAHNLSSESPLGQYLTVEEYTRIVSDVNLRLREAFDPWNWRNIVYNLAGVLTFWLSELVMYSSAEIKLAELEDYIDSVNKSILNDKGLRMISPRRAGYLSVSTQDLFEYGGGDKCCNVIMGLYNEWRYTEKSPQVFEGSV
jgi:hypothetical protein